MALDDRAIRPPSFSVMVGIVVGIAVLVLLSASLVVVPAGERAVVFDNIRGVLHEARDEGITLIMPFLQKAVRYDIKTQTYSMTGSSADEATREDRAIEARTSDGQQVNLELSVRFRPIPEEVWKLHQEVGVNYATKIIVPEIRSVIRNVIAEHNVEDLYSQKRRGMQSKMADDLTRSFKRYHLELNEVLIRNVLFSEEYQKKIEAKQVALQEAQRMQYVLQKEIQEKQRKIIEAEGDARSVEIRGEMLKRYPQLIQMEYIQKLAPGVKAVITDQNTILNFGKFLEEKE